MSTHRALPSEFTIYSLSGLLQEWLAWLPDVSTAKPAGTVRPAAWPVDASGVLEVDAAGLQMLVALSRSLASCNKALVLTDPSPPLARACEALGLSGLLAGGELPGAGA